MNPRMKHSAKYHYLNATVAEIFWATVGSALWKFIPSNGRNDPIAVFIFGGIGAVSLLVTSPVWAPFVGAYAIGKKISNNQEKSQLEIEWEKEEKEQSIADMAAREKRLKTMPVPPNLSFVERSDLVKNSQLERLPKDLCGIIGGYLDQKSLSQLMHASRSTHVLFGDSWKASALLNFVKNSNYAKTGEILKLIKPQLILKREMLTRSDGGSEYVSPIELSIRQYDIKMWTLLRNAIHGTGVDDLAASFNHSSLTFSELPGSCVDLQPLYDAYETFQELYSAWLNGDKVTVEQLSQSLILIARLQRELLPQHVWNDFADYNFKWNIENDFSEVVQSGLGSQSQFSVSSIMCNNDICARGIHEFHGMTLANVTVKGLCFDKNNPQSNVVNNERLENLAKALRYDAVVLRNLIDHKSAEFNWKIMLSNTSSDSNCKITTSL